MSRKERPTNEDLYAAFQHEPPVPDPPLVIRKLLDSLTLEELYDLQPEIELPPIQTKGKKICPNCHHFKKGPPQTKTSFLKHMCPSSRSAGCPSYAVCPTRRRDLHIKEVGSLQTQKEIDAKKKELSSKFTKDNKDKRAANCQLISEELSNKFKAVLPESESEIYVRPDVQSKLLLVSRAAVQAAEQNLPFNLTEKLQTEQQRKKVPNVNLPLKWFGGKNLPPNLTEMDQVLSSQDSEKKKNLDVPSSEEIVDYTLSNSKKNLDIIDLTDGLDDEQIQLARNRIAQEEIKNRKRKREKMIVKVMEDAHLQFNNSTKGFQLRSRLKKSQFSSDNCLTTFEANDSLHFLLSDETN